MSALDDEKQSDAKTETETEEPLSVLLNKLYKFCYESINSQLPVDEFQRHYTEITQQYQSSLQHLVNTCNAATISPPKNAAEMVAALELLLQMVTSDASFKSNELFEWIFGATEVDGDEVDGDSEKDSKEKKDKLQLWEYCKTDDVDAAIIFLLKYKLVHESAKEICNWVNCSSAGIHHVLQHFEPLEPRAWYYAQDKRMEAKFPKMKYLYPWKEESEMSAEEKEQKARVEAQNQEMDAKMNAFAGVVVANRINKCQRRLFLLELLLKEGASAGLVGDDGGVTSNRRSAFMMALSNGTDDVLQLFGSAADTINVDEECVYFRNSQRHDMLIVWKPIHTAIERSGTSTKWIQLLVEHGADINDYKISRSDGEYCSDVQMTALYSLYMWRGGKSDSDLLQLVLQEQARRQGVVLDVNHDTTQSRHDGCDLLQVVLQTQSRHGAVPDVNRFSCYKDFEKKPDELYQKEVEAQQQRRQQREQQRQQRRQQQGQGSEDSEEEEEEYFDVRRYVTPLHAAISRCDLQVVKLLLIHGANVDLCKITTTKAHMHTRVRSDNANSEQRHAKFVQFYNEFMAKKTKLEWYESVETVYDILNGCTDILNGGDDKGKIEKILRAKTIWFPEMIDLYPKNMGLALSNITKVLGEIRNIPNEVVNIVIGYFFSFAPTQSEETYSNNSMVKDSDEDSGEDIAMMIKAILMRNYVWDCY